MYVYCMKRSARADVNQLIFLPCQKVTAKLAVIFLVSSLNRMKAGEIRAERQKPREACDSRGLKIPKQ